VLPATRRKWTNSINLRQAGRYSIYLPRRDRRLSWPKLNTEMVCLSTVNRLPGYYYWQVKWSEVFSALSSVQFISLIQNLSFTQSCNDGCADAYKLCKYIIFSFQQAGITVRFHDIVFGEGPTPPRHPWQIQVLTDSCRQTFKRHFTSARFD